MYQGVVVVRDLKHQLQYANEKLEAASKLRQYVAESMAKQENLEMELALAKLRMDELENSNKILQALIQTFQTECVDLKEDQRRKVEEIDNSIFKLTSPNPH